MAVNMAVNMACAIGQVTGSVLAYGYPTQSITLNYLNSDTTYNYCIIVTNVTDMGQVGEPVCGSFITRTITTDDSDTCDGMYIAINM